MSRVIRGGVFVRLNAIGLLMPSRPCFSGPEEGRVALIFFVREEMLSKCVNNHLNEEWNNGVCRLAKVREITEESGDAPRKAFESVFKSIRYYIPQRGLPKKKYWGAKRAKSLN